MTKDNTRIRLSRLFNKRHVEKRKKRKETRGTKEIWGFVFYTHIRLRKGKGGKGGKHGKETGKKIERGQREKWCEEKTKQKTRNVTPKVLKL